MLTIHIRINDEHEQATPCRLRISDAEGNVHTPFGYEEVIPGSCEVPLPAGVPLHIQATKGIEYRPINTTVTLKPGQMSLRLQLERWVDFAELGWVAGNICRDDFSPHDVALEGAAAGTTFVNLLIHERLDCTIANMAAFSGTTAAVQLGNTAVIVNTLNETLHLGDVALLACHRPILPLFVDGETVPDDWLITDWCDQCHRKNGLTVWMNPDIESQSLALVATLLGKMDAILTWQSLDVWYLLLNLGLSIPMISENHTIASVTKPDYRAWIEAVRAGHCFITDGPIFLDDSRCQSLSKFAKLERVVDGDVVETVTPHCHNNLWEAQLRQPVTTGCRWSAMRVCDEAGRLRAHSKVTIHNPNRRPTMDATSMIDCINRTKQWAIEHGQFNNPKRRDEMVQLCEDAIQILIDPQR